MRDARALLQERTHSYLNILCTRCLVAAVAAVVAAAAVIAAKGKDNALFGVRVRVGARSETRRGLTTWR